MHTQQDSNEKVTLIRMDKTVEKALKILLIQSDTKLNRDPGRKDSVTRKQKKIL